VFAFLVAQINEIISKVQADTKELEDYLDAYLVVRPRCESLYVSGRLSTLLYGTEMRDQWFGHRLDTGTLLSIRAFERYSFQEDQLIRQSQSVLARKSLPEHLRVAVAKRLEDNIFSKVTLSGRIAFSYFEWAPRGNFYCRCSSCRILIRYRTFARFSQQRC